MNDHREAATGWRMVDIVVTAVIGVVFGVVFWAWTNWVWGPTTIFFGQANPAQYLLSGVWLMPAVLAPLVVRRAGAAFFAEAMAGIVSMFLGSYWGADAALSGVMQGLGAELVFALFRYRAWSLPVALLAGAGAGVAEWIHDWIFYFSRVDMGTLLALGAFMLISAVAIAGAGSWLLARALAETGVLEPFASGRSRRAI
jgi:energy-coupling factor transport system substrate-specific component